MFFCESKKRYGAGVIHELLSMKVFFFGLAFISFMWGCATTKTDVMKTDADAAHNADAAYNRADEKAFKAQNEADEKSDQVLDQANIKVEQIQDEAQAKADKAYLEAEQVAAAERERVMEVRRKEYIDRTQARIDRMREDVEKYANTSAYKAGSRKKKISQVEVMKSSVDHAEKELNTTRAAKTTEWEKTIPQVDEATRQADEVISRTQTVR